MIIAIVGRKNGQSDSSHKNLRDLLSKYAEIIIQHGHVVVFEEETATSFEFEDVEKKSFSQIADYADICVVMGGDGTMLNAAKSLRSHTVSNIPILGINLGKVGFITDVPHDFDPVKIIKMLEKKEYTVERRTMLRIYDNINSKSALNDVVITRSTGKIIEFNVLIDNKFAYSARGDGIMVSTPTGSTAYALSGGGPIMHPEARVIEILPIMAQSLSTRPLIINDTSSVDIELKSGMAEIYIDGNLHREMLPGEHLEIGRADRKVEFIHPKMKDLEYNYYETLADKLNWHYLPGTRKT